MNIKPKTIFLIDGLGAILSAFLLGVVLIHYQELIGMPEKVLYFLAFIPCLFIIYSFSCFFFLRDNWRSFLKYIALANFLYCILSIAMMMVHRDSLTTLGYTYFVIEIIVVLIVVGVEYQVYKGFKR